MPVDFETWIPVFELRRRRWRTRERFPAVWDGWMWLAVIAGRVQTGFTPVSEAEFSTPTSRTG